MHTTFMTKASGTHISTFGQCPMPLSCSTVLRTTVTQSVVSTWNVSAAVRAATVCHLSGSTAHASFSAYAPWCLVVSMEVTRSRAWRSGLSCGAGVACSVASAILHTIAGFFRPDDIFTWRATEVPLGSQLVGAPAAMWVSERALRR